MRSAMIRSIFPGLGILMFCAVLIDVNPIYWFDRCYSSLLIAALLPMSERIPLRYPGLWSRSRMLYWYNLSHRAGPFPFYYNYILFKVPMQPQDIVFLCLNVALSDTQSLKWDTLVHLCSLKCITVSYFCPVSHLGNNALFILIIFNRHYIR